MDLEFSPPPRPHGPSGWSSHVHRWSRGPLAALVLAAVAAALCGAVLHPKGLVAAAGLLVVVAVGAVWPWLAMIGLRGELSFGTARGREGRPSRARLDLRNRAPWGAWGLVVGDETGSLQAALGQLGAGRRAEAEWEFVPTIRGEYPLGRPAVATGFPFGLLTARRPLRVGSPLLVWPATFAVPPVPDLSGGPRRLGAPSSRIAGDEGDMMGVRDYRRGDSLRRVHWPQTARQGRLIVRELESTGALRAQVVLDVQTASYPTDAALDWAVRVAASFVEAWARQGVAVELVAGDRHLVAAAGTGAAGLAPLMDALSRARVTPSAELSGVLTSGPCLAFRDGPRIVVTTDLGAGVGRPGRGSERFVVLSSAGFGGPAGPPGGPRPWIWIDGPETVREALGGARMEVRHAG